MTHDLNRPERPRIEPEIIPPGRPMPGEDWRGRARPYASAMHGGTHRIYVGRVGPFGIALLMALIGLLIAVVLIATIGAVLVWIPILALLVVAGAILRFLRR